MIAAAADMADPQASPGAFSHSLVPNRPHCGERQRVPRWGVESHQLVRKGKSVCIVFVGIDLAKNVFAVHGIDEAGKAELMRPKVARARLGELMAALPPCTLGMEACSGAHRWARQFQAQGHTVKGGHRAAADGLDRAHAGGCAARRVAGLGQHRHRRSACHRPPHRSQSVIGM